MSDGGDSDQGTVTNHLFTGATAAQCSYATDNPHTGPCSLKTDSGALNAAGTFSKLTVWADAGRRSSFWVYFSALPTSDANFFSVSNTANSTTIFRLQLRTTGKLRFVGSTNGADGTAVIQAGRWYRITISSTITSTSVNEFRCFVNGVADATATNLTLAGTGSNRWNSGWSTAPGASIQNWVDDIYVDDGTTLDDPGDIRVCYKAPTNSNSNTFDTTIGTGAINERPISETNGRQHAASTTANCNWNLQAANAGDVDVTMMAIVAIMGWAWVKIGTGTAPIIRMMLNGVETVISPSTSSALFQVIAMLSSYPTNAAGIGIDITTGNPADTFLYECGVMVAYVPGLPIYGPCNPNQMQQLLAT